MSVDAENIAKLLRLTGLEDEEADIRANFLIEDLNWLQIGEFALSCPVYPIAIEGGVRRIPVPEYRFGKTQFDVNNAANSRDKRATSIGGSPLNVGNLQYLSKVSKIARKMIPSLWLQSNDLKHYLQTPAHHLDTLNEIWWLGRFPLAVNIIQRHVQKPPFDIDWRFELLGTGIGGSNLHLNLEVKNRPTDVTRFVHGRVPDARKLFKDVDKFVQGNSDEINVLALTLFGPVERDIQLLVSEWLARPWGPSSAIDAVLLWTHEARTGSGFDMQIKTSKGSFLHAGIVYPPDEEDRSLIRRIEHTVSKDRLPPEIRDALPDGL